MIDCERWHAPPTFEQTLDMMQAQAGPMAALVVAPLASGGVAFTRHPWHGRSGTERAEALYWSCNGGGQVPMGEIWR